MPHNAGLADSATSWRTLSCPPRSPRQPRRRCHHPWSGISVAARTIRPTTRLFFFFNDTATTEIYTLSLHDALPIYCINYRKENFVERVKALTGGKGVPVVYDSVGKDTFTGSLDCLQPRGLMVSFGNSSGAVPPFELVVLSQKGSLYLTRPTLVTHTSKREDLVATAKDLFDVVLSGKVKIDVNHRYALKDAAQAQRDLEARKTTGSTILIP